MLEPTLRHGLSSSVLDVLVCTDGNLLILHCKTGSVWIANLLTTEESRRLEFTAIRDDFHRAHLLLDEGRDYGDECDHSRESD